jgi:hypothetical protein
MRAHGWCSSSSTNWRVRRGKNRRAGLPRCLRKTCGFFFLRSKGRRSPPRPGVVLRYVRCLITRVSLQITATLLERSSVRIAASIWSFVFLRGSIYDR